MTSYLQNESRRNFEVNCQWAELIIKIDNNDGNEGFEYRDVG